MIMKKNKNKYRPAMGGVAYYEFPQKTVNVE